jgi:hypothetical protein
MRQPLILQDLVIDLDSVDNKYVKRVEDIIAEPQIVDGIALAEAPEAISPTKQEMDGGQKLGRGDEPLMTTENWLDPGFQETEEIHGLRTIIGPDLLSYALFGSQFERARLNEHPNRYRIQNIFLWNGIDTLDSAQTVIERLTCNFTTNSEDLLNHLGFDGQKKEAILSGIRACDDLDILQKMISLLSSTVDGCEYLASHGSILVECIEKCQKTKRGYNTDSEVLKVLNNLFWNMSSKGVEPGLDICAAGILFASKSYALRSVKMYLKEMQRRSYQLQSKHLLRPILHMAIQSRRVLSLSGYRTIDIDEKNNEVMKLVTGWQCSGIPEVGERKTLCLASFMPQDHDGEDINASFTSYHAYIIALGYLRATKAILYEWSIVKDESENGNKAAEEVFATALLLAGDGESARKILEQLQSNVKRNSSPTAAPLKKQEASRTRLGNILEQLYALQGLKMTRKLAAKIHHGNGPTPWNIYSSKLRVEDINPFLITELLDQSSRPTRRAWLPQRTVDWVTSKEGVDGLGVRNHKKELLYFKGIDGSPVYINIRRL